MAENSDIPLTFRPDSVGALRVLISDEIARVEQWIRVHRRSAADGQAANDPLHSLTTLPRFGLVTVMIDDEPAALSDIGMRMLQPHEMAAAHELTLPEWIEVRGVRRKLTKTEATRLIGNSVPKRMAQLLAHANVAHALHVPQQAREAA